MNKHQQKGRILIIYKKISISPITNNPITPIRIKKGFFPDDFFTSSNKENNQLRQVKTLLINKPTIHSDGSHPVNILSKNINFNPER